MTRLKAAAIALPFLAAVFPLSAVAQHSGHHQAVRAADLKWAPVPTLPKGAQISVIEGPLTQAGPFTLRLKLPANYQIPPHTHPAVERVTVLSGTFNVGMGEKFNRSGTQALRAGDIIIMQPGTPHYGWTKGETVVQLHGTGPWGITYVNPSDDPRKQ